MLRSADARASTSSTRIGSLWGATNAQRLSFVQLLYTFWRRRSRLASARMWSPRRRRSATQH